MQSSLEAPVAGDFLRLLYSVGYMLHHTCIIQVGYMLHHTCIIQVG